MLFRSAKYFAEAADLYRQIRDVSGADATLTYHLVWLYGNAGLAATAGEELAKIPAAK